MRKYFFALLLLPFFSFGYIYKLDIWRKWNKEQKAYQHVYLFSDNHENHWCHDYDKDQLNYFFKYTQETKEGIKIIVESLHGDKKKKFKWRQKPAEAKNILARIYKLHKKDFNIHNVECRFALAKLIKNKSKSLLDKAIEEIVDNMAKVYNYADGTYLNKYYLYAMQRVLKNVSKVSSHYIDKIKHAEHFSDEKIIEHSCDLIDCHALHKIHTSFEPKICVFMGGEHIENISSILFLNGYDLIYSSGTKYKIISERGYSNRVRIIGYRPLEEKYFKYFSGKIPEFLLPGRIQFPKLYRGLYRTIFQLKDTTGVMNHVSKIFKKFKPVVLFKVKTMTYWGTFVCGCVTFVFGCSVGISLEHYMDPQI